MKRRFLFFFFLGTLILGESCEKTSFPNTPKKQKLIVYSPHGVEILKPIEALFEAAYPDIDLVYFDLPTATCVGRIRAEKENPQADIWWGGPITEFIAAEEAHLLAEYVPSWKEFASPSSYSANNRWYTNWQTPEVIMYNQKRLKPEEVPKDWDDLLDPKWQGRIVIRDPLQSGTMKTIFGAMILRASSPEAGYEWLKKLDRQNLGKYSGKPTIMYEQLKRGAADITLWNMADAFIQSQQNGYPFAFVIPSSGTPVVLEGIAILEGAPHRATAETFFEFVTSKEQLILQAKQLHRIPITRKDVATEHLPEWMKSQSIQAMDISWPEFSTQSTEWMEYWKKHIRGTGAE